MAVRVCYMSDRDEDRLFASKKEADAHDKMLELAENISAMMGHRFPALGEGTAEEIGLFLANEKALLLKAVKGRPEAIDEWLQEQTGKVTAMSARKSGAGE